MIIFRCVSVKLVLEILRVCLESFPDERFSVSKQASGYNVSHFFLTIERVDDELALEIEERIALAICKDMEAVSREVERMKQKISDMEAEMLEDLGNGEGERVLKA